jgi:hypothetical protein
MRRARLSVFQGRASDSKNSPHPNEPFTGQDMLYSRPKYALNHMIEMIGKCEAPDDTAWQG